MNETRNSRLHTIGGRIASVALAGALLFPLMGVTGCGPEAQQVAAPAPPSNTPPGGGSASDYQKQMEAIQGKGKTGSPGTGASPGKGAPPGPGASPGK